jgi:hypothetical protein
MDTQHEAPSPVVALLWREWRQDRVFLLVNVAMLGLAGSLGRLHEGHVQGVWPAVLAAACGLILGVRAYAPDSADGTKRFVQALPVPDDTVLLAKLAVRVVAILAGTVFGLMLGALGPWYELLLGASVLFACLVGVLAGQVLDQSSTAFAAGASVLVVAAQLAASFLAIANQTGNATQYTWGAAGLYAATGAMLLVSFWVARQR